MFTKWPRTLLCGLESNLRMFLIIYEGCSNDFANNYLIQFTTFTFKVFLFPTPSVTTTFTLLVPFFIFSSNS